MLLVLPLIIGCPLVVIHWLLSWNNSNSQQQPTTGYKQTNKLLSGLSLLTRLKLLQMDTCATIQVS